ncbi:hypothetical protein [Aeromonas veronii]|uniref:hypothetical protein n=1 Tax=Aeromonas veronii TaxID=654 RepID=UPI001FD6C2EC|nr:hypothetical protein [Aeromonas veronii]MCJ8220114.1 hypothetical protein [Aeromonas veronii]
MQEKMLAYRIKVSGGGEAIVRRLKWGDQFGMGCFNMIAYLNDNAVVKLDNLSAEI